MRLTRICLWLLATSTAVVGVPATVAPGTFYDDFPFAAHWVDRLPPYNEHLVTDVGGLYLAFTVLFVWAAITLSSTLVRAVCVAWLLAALLHLAFHATHLGHLSTADGVAEIVSLAFVVGLPIVALVGVRR